VSGDFTALASLVMPNPAAGAQIQDATNVSNSAASHSAGPPEPACAVPASHNALPGACNESALLVPKCEELAARIRAEAEAQIAEIQAKAAAQIATLRDNAEARITAEMGKMFQQAQLSTSPRCTSWDSKESVADHVQTPLTTPRDPAEPPERNPKRPRNEHTTEERTTKVASSTTNPPSDMPNLGDTSEVPKEDRPRIVSVAPMEYTPTSEPSDSPTQAPPDQPAPSAPYKSGQCDRSAHASFIIEPTDLNEASSDGGWTAQGKAERAQLADGMKGTVREACQNTNTLLQPTAAAGASGVKLQRSDLGAGKRESRSTMTLPEFSRTMNADLVLPGQGTGGLAPAGLDLYATLEFGKGDFITHFSFAGTIAKQNPDSGLVYFPSRADDPVWLKLPHSHSDGSRQKAHKAAWEAYKEIVRTSQASLANCQIVKAFVLLRSLLMLNRYGDNGGSYLGKLKTEVGTTFRSIQECISTDCGSTKCSLHLHDPASELEEWATEAKYTAKDIAACIAVLKRDIKNSIHCINIVSHLFPVTGKRRRDC
jgi:hypothetical protein